jgi:hypothetical protein
VRPGRLERIEASTVVFVAFAEMIEGVETMKRTIRCLGFLALALVCLALPMDFALGQKPKREDDEDKKQAALDGMENAQRLYLAAEMERFGMENKAPDALIAAGRLLLMVPHKAGKLDPAKDKTISLEADKDGSTAKPEDNDAHAKRLFDAALKMDPKNAGLEKIVKEAAKTKPPGTKGNVEGPKTITRTLAPGGRDVWYFKFEPNLPGYVSVSAGLKMHIEVLRPTGEALTDVNYPSASATFTPTNDAKWTVRVHNVSGKTNTYTLTTN